MTLFKEPDWQDQFATGFWQIGYRVSGERKAIFFRGGGPDAEPSPQREWGFGLLRGPGRDAPGEQQLLANTAFARKVSSWTADGEEMLLVREADIDAFRIVQETFAPDAAEGTAQCG